MTQAGHTIRQLAQKRQNLARQRFLLAGILAVLPPLFYFLFALTFDFGQNKEEFVMGIGEQNPIRRGKRNEKIEHSSDKWIAIDS